MDDSRIMKVSPAEMGLVVNYRAENQTHRHLQLAEQKVKDTFYRKHRATKDWERAVVEVEEARIANEVAREALTGMVI